MSNVFVLHPDNIENFDALETALASEHPFRVFQTLDNIKSALADVSEAVVILSEPVDKLGSIVNQLKSVLSSVACLTVCSQVDPCVTLLTDVDVVTTPIKPQELKTRVKTLSRLSELIANVEHCAQFDEVTQLHNSRYFINRINAEISLAKRHMSPLTCMILEVNFYQAYLDSYGYEFVNDLLKHIALIVDTHKRQEDTVARIGDHEIAILLTRSTEKGAYPLAKRIIEEIENTPFKRDNVSEDIDVFAGIVSFPVPDEDQKNTDANTMLRYGRHATHQAKCNTEEHIQLFSEIKPNL